MILSTKDLRTLAANHAAQVHYDQEFIQEESGAVIQIALIVKNNGDHPEILGTYLDIKEGFIALPVATLRDNQRMLNYLECI